VDGNNTVSQEFTYPYAVALPLVGEVDQNGTAYVRYGSLTAPLAGEWAGATQIAVASDPVNGPLIAVISNAGNVYAKEGATGAQWVEVFL
jgi:hypothetical protein